jgi:signal peptidase
MAIQLPPRSPDLARPARRAILAGRMLGLATARGVLALGAMLLVWSAAPMALGWRGSVVMSGSMEPRIHPGDVVLSQPVAAAAVVPGQVVLVANPAKPGTLLMHRFVRRNPGGDLITRGDANAVDDSTPVPPSLVRGLPRLRVPYVGLPVLWLHEGAYGRVGLLGSAVLGILVLAGAAGGRRPPRPPAADGQALPAL